MACTEKPSSSHFILKKYLNFFAVDIMKKMWSIQVTNMDIIFGQFLHPVKGEGIGYRVWMGSIIILAHYKFHYIRVHENLV